MSTVFKTKGIVLRSTKYGETSLVSSIYTQTHGLQSYLINGVRSYTKKGPGKANLFQPASILDLVIYHNDLKNLQRLRDFKWSYLYQQLSSDVTRNTVALFMVELLQKTIRQPEPNENLFDLIEDALIHLDRGSDAVTANYPIYFAIHLASFLGLQMRDNFSTSNNVLDLVEGAYVSSAPQHNHYLDPEAAEYVSQFLKILHPKDLSDLRVRQVLKTRILDGLIEFYSLQVPEFGSMKTIPILREILS